MSPWHTIQLSSGQFIVCHGRPDDPLHRVCLLGSDGSVVKSFGGPKGSGSQHFDTHNQFVDRNEFSFASDMNNYRVVVLVSSLKLCMAYLMLCHANS